METAPPLGKPRVGPKSFLALADRLSANLSAYRHLDGHLALDAWTQAAAATSRALSQALPEISS